MSGRLVVLVWLAAAALVGCSDPVEIGPTCPGPRCPELACRTGHPICEADGWTVRSCAVDGASAALSACAPSEACVDGACVAEGCGHGACAGRCSPTTTTHRYRAAGLEPFRTTRDLDRDGHQDLISVHQLSYDVYVHWGDGSGRLSAPVMTRTGLAQRNTWPIGRNWGGMAFADFDEDGDVDVVTSQPDSLHVQLLRLEGRVLRADPPIDQPYTGRSMAAVDANHDHHADLILFLGDKNCMAVRLGHGDGSFGPTGDCLWTPEGNGWGAHHVALDWDGDGFEDLLDSQQAGIVRVRRSADDGTFPVLAQFEVGSTVGYVQRYGDPSSDAVPAFSVIGAGTIAIFERGADPTTLVPRCAAVTMDLPDLGTFVRPLNPAIADFDEDGTPDEAFTTDFEEGDLQIYSSAAPPAPPCERGECGGTCMPTPAHTVHLSTSETQRAVRVGRFDSDAHDDVLVVGTTSVVLFRGDGAGHFATGDVIAVGGETASVDLGDLTGDGVADLVLAQPTLDRILLLRGTGTSFVFERALTEPEAMHVGTFDWDRDGDLDVFVWAAERKANAGCAVIRLNPGNGDLAAAGADCAFDVHDPAYPPLALESVRVDWDGEGIDEYVDPWSWRGRVRLHTTSVATDGTVELFRYSGFTTGSYAKPIHVQRLDLDHDGRPELLHRDETESTARGVYEITSGGWVPYCDSMAIPADLAASHQQDIAGEFDYDGLPDFVYLDATNGYVEVRLTAM